ncbi:CS012 protein, partial [Atlantisia rogersi]|nr:CS012 protein [Atlantisia rogersi]
MPFSVDEVIQLFCQLSQEKGMKAAVKHSGRGFWLASGAAFIGGVLGGPPGIAVGAAFGGLLGAVMSSGQFRPVPEILLELSPAERKKLYDEAVDIVSCLEWTDVAPLTALVMGSTSIQQKLIRVLINYLSKNLNVKVQCRK